MMHIALNGGPLAAVAPTWIEVLPDGQDIVGFDGRRWRNDSPSRLVANSRLPLPVDYEHASEHRAPQGLDAPAAGWIDRIEVRGGSAIWGHVEWTGRAAQQIQAREYRYLSPVFQYEKDTQRIVRLTSIGLTNQPNLPLTALNQTGRADPAPEDALQEAARRTFARVATIREHFGTPQKFAEHLAMNRGR